MRRSKTNNISEIISVLLKEQGLEDKLYENRLLNSWETLLGKTIGRATQKLYIRDRILYVNISSSVIKHELMMIRDDIVFRLNEKAGKKIIDKIVLR